jgi:hypothetical protein
MAAYSTRTLTFLKSLYWIFWICVQLVVVYLLFTTDRAITALLWLVLGFILLFLMYGVYFPAGDAESQWPPYIRGCPDYLTQIAPGKCVDYQGIAGSTILKKSDPAHPPNLNDSTHVFDATGTKDQKANKASAYGLSWEGIN